MRRSLLFVPGNAPNLMVNADILGADAVIFDLEDAVAPGEKDAARILVRNALQTMRFDRCETVVRVNGLDTAYWQADLDAIVPQQPSFLMTPKIAGPADVAQYDAYLTELETKHCLPVGQIGLFPLLETALGVEQAFAVACAGPRVAGLQLGAEDLTADLRCKRTKEGREIEYARGRLVCAARAAGVAVYDTPFTDVDDEEGVLADARYAKAMGFDGKASISPRHLRAIHAVFSPTTREVCAAQEIVEAIEAAERSGKGAVALHGKMIDAPIVRRARQTLAAAAEIRERGESLGD